MDKVLKRKKDDSMYDRRYIELEKLMNIINKLNKELQLVKKDINNKESKSKEYVREVSKARITRSMSRVGRCIDNASMESFWSHFKDEYYYDCTFITYEELVTGIADYINYYNNERYQWNLKNLTPVEYRNQAA